MSDKNLFDDISAMIKGIKICGPIISGKENLVDVQILEVSAESVLELGFSKPMKFPDQFIDILNSQQDGVRRYLDLFMYSYDTEVLDNNLSGWIVQEITSQSIKVKLMFDNILEVSQGNKKDKLIA